LFPVGTTTVQCDVDGNGGSTNEGSGTFQVVVESLTITTTSLPSATTGVPYEAQLTAGGGNPPYTWKLVSGSGKLPRGLKLDKSTGAISGTPTKHSITSTFTVEVLDTKTTTRPHTRDTAEATFTIDVAP
jgi:hypothetical protein